MTNKEYLRLCVKTDLERNSFKKATIINFIIFYLKSLIFRYLYWYRVLSYAKMSKNPILKGLARYKTRRLRIKTGFQFADATIGPGMRIQHTGTIVIHPDTIIGSNLTLVTEIVIGQKFPNISPKTVIGDNVYLGSGVKIIGSLNIGNNVIIGANAVVLKDLPADSTAVGIPAKVVKSN